jgi:propanediol utilization protein
VPVVVTTRHVHWRAELIEQLFCDLYRLHSTVHERRGLQYATMETGTLIEPQRRIRKVPVMGPPSTTNQREISRSDALAMGSVHRWANRAI